MDFASVLGWVQAIGLTVVGVVVVAAILKYAGLDFLWQMMSKVVDWSVSGFQTIVFAAPTPVKMGIFLLLLSTIGAVVISPVVGLRGVCAEDGSLWTTDDLFEGASSQMMGSVGGSTALEGESSYTVASGDSDEHMYSNLLDRNLGALVTTNDRVTLSSGLDSYVIAVDGDSSRQYDICRDTITGTCYVSRQPRSVSGFLRDTYAGGCSEDSGTFIGVGGELIPGVLGTKQSVGHFKYSVSGELGSPAGDVVVSIDAGDTSDITLFEDVASTCVRGIDGVGYEELNFQIYPWQYKIFQISARNVTFPVVASRAAVAAPVRSVDSSRTSNVELVKLFVDREGSGFHRVEEWNQTSAIRFSCSVNEDRTVEKKLTLYGFPVFDMQFMLLFTVVIVLGMFIWGRR